MTAKLYDFSTVGESKHAENCVVARNETSDSGVAVSGHGVLSSLIFGKLGVKSGICLSTCVPIVGRSTQKLVSSFDWVVVPLIRIVVCQQLGDSLLEDVRPQRLGGRVYLPEGGVIFSSIVRNVVVNSDRNRDSHIVEPYGVNANWVDCFGVEHIVDRGLVERKTRSESRESIVVQIASFRVVNAYARLRVALKQSVA